MAEIAKTDLQRSYLVGTSTPLAKSARLKMILRPIAHVIEEPSFTIKHVAEYNKIYGNVQKDHTPRFPRYLSVSFFIYRWWKRWCSFRIEQVMMAYSSDQIQTLQVRNVLFYVAASATAHQRMDENKLQ
jgi:hypothetical protein